MRSSAVFPDRYYCKSFSNACKWVRINGHNLWPIVPHASRATLLARWQCERALHRWIRCGMSSIESIQIRCAQCSPRSNIQPANITSMHNKTIPPTAVISILCIIVVMLCCATHACLCVPASGWRASTPWVVCIFHAPGKHFEIIRIYLVVPRFQWNSFKLITNQSHSIQLIFFRRKVTQKGSRARRNAS